MCYTKRVAKRDHRFPLHKKKTNTTAGLSGSGGFNMTKNNETYMMAKALHFAAVKHTDQRRKGERAEPYINHVSEVAWTLAQHTGGQDLNLVLAGMLHDTVEDTDTSFEELEQEFGADVAALVREVTDDKSLPKETRKQLQIENAPKKSDRAKMLKMADKISNLRSLLHSPPAEWPDERRQKYFEWAKAVIDGCRGVNKGLEYEFQSAYKKAIEQV